MRLGIDASNIRAGGGVTHLVELLRAADPLAYGFSQVIVWGGQATVDLFEDRPWLIKAHDPRLDRPLPFRICWQRLRLSSLARQAGCGVLFAPGGFYTGDFRPFVTMCRNLLPFEWQELWRYGFSWMTIRLGLLRLVQARSFRASNGVIFLTDYARKAIVRFTGMLQARTIIIPHGVNQKLICAPRTQQPIREYSLARPFRLLYVSIIDVYKHQWHVVEAAAQLRREGLPVQLKLVGPAYAPALTRLERVQRRVDPGGEVVRYRGPVSYSELPMVHREADLAVFASSCENMPNVLLETMASGLPIACSNRGPMPEVLGEAGVYFDPESSGDIARAIRLLIESPELRTEKAQMAFEQAQTFSWKHCADETFGFLAEVAVKQCGSARVAI